MPIANSSNLELIFAPSDKLSAVKVKNPSGYLDITISKVKARGGIVRYKLETEAGAVFIAAQSKAALIEGIEALDRFSVTGNGGQRRVSRF